MAEKKKVVCAISKDVSGLEDRIEDKIRGSEKETGLSLQPTSISVYMIRDEEYERRLLLACVTLKEE